ncbi:MAG: membrane protein insertase YidC, partial [Clostridia bacterium]|nr:membrane protein insertase YidC [Clostridia bacterium]
MNSIMDIIYIPFGYLVRFFDKLCGGQYILTLLLFSLAVKILMLPFSIKQQKNQIKGATLRPKMALIEKKYAGRTDQKTLQKKQQELMELQQREGYSPLAGCLPLLIQFPVLIGLYQVIRCPLTYIARFSNEVVAKVHNTAITLGGNYSGTAIENTTDVAWKTVKNMNQIGLVDTIKQNPSAFEGIEGFATEAIPNFEIFGGWMNLAETPSFKFASGANPWLLLIPLLTFLGSLAT